MSAVDPPGGVDRAYATPAGNPDSSTACPTSASPSTSAPSSWAHAAAPWPGVAFPRYHATYIPVGGAAAAIMLISPTPPRYMIQAAAAAAPGTAEDPAATATPPEDPAATETPPEDPAATATPSESLAASGNGKLAVLSQSSSKISVGLTEIWKKSQIIGVIAIEFCSRVRVPKVSMWAEWHQLPGFFQGLSCVLAGVNKVFEGSSEAFIALHGRSLIVSAIRGPVMVYDALCSYIPYPSHPQLKSGTYAPYAGGSSSQQGLHNALSSYLIKRICVDSIIVVEDTSGSRRSPKKVLPRVQLIRTMEELTEVVEKFKLGDAVHLIDTSEEDFPLDLAVDFWKFLLKEGATALLKRDSNLSRMSKKAYSLLEEKRQLEIQLNILNNEADQIKHYIHLLSEMLKNTKPKLARHPKSINFNSVSGNQPSTYEEKATDLLASQDYNPAVSDTDIECLNNSKKDCNPAASD